MLENKTYAGLVNLKRRIRNQWRKLDVSDQRLEFLWDRCNEAIESYWDREKKLAAKLDLDLLRKAQENDPTRGYCRNYADAFRRGFVDAIEIHGFFPEAFTKQ